VVLIGLRLGTARRDEDRVGVVERGGIVGPSVEMDLDAEVLQAGRRHQAVLEQEHVLLVLVRSLRVGVERPGDEDDLLRLGFLSAGEREGHAEDRRGRHRQDFFPLAGGMPRTPRRSFDSAMSSIHAVKPLPASW
jgi:hypothetical protein